MHPVSPLIRLFSSPVLLIVLVWCVSLVLVAIGPIDYVGQPSFAVLLAVAAGLGLFSFAYWAGMLCFRIPTQHKPVLLAPRPATLNLAIAVASSLGIAGIALIALDRVVLSGVNNGEYAELLRCAPELSGFIEVRRTALLYVGYVTFSFGFASLILFLLKGEQIRGWVAALGQLSIVSPIGYSIIYSGRSSILLIVLMFAMAMVVRLVQGRTALPKGHHLVIKLLVIVALLGIHSTTVWSTRRQYCEKMTPVIVELMNRMKERDAELLKRKQRDAGLLKRKERDAELLKSKERDTERSKVATAQPPPPDRQPSNTVEPSTKDSAAPVSKPEDNQDAGDEKLPGVIGGNTLRKMMEEANSRSRASYSTDIAQLVAIMQQSWYTEPRAYMLSALNSGWISPRIAQVVIGYYFYATHGIRTIDIVWRERDHFAPNWGVYEVGVLAQIMKVFLPGSGQPERMLAEVKAAGIYGFYPSTLAAAFVDFGFAGAVVYVLIWGWAAGWSAAGARHSALATPALLLTFILATVVLSPIQSPLGLSNSALVLVSIIVVGLAADFGSRKQDATAAARTAEQASGAG
jgi:hypothetical protein